MTAQFIDTKDVAKLIRSALREAFPDTRFSVRLSRYSGGSSIDVYWTDGPTAEMVECIAGAFQGGYFDGMTDHIGMAAPITVRVTELPITDYPRTKYGTPAESAPTYLVRENRVLITYGSGRYQSWVYSEQIMVPRHA